MAPVCSAVAASPPAAPGGDPPAVMPPAASGGDPDAAPAVEPLAALVCPCRQPIPVPESKVKHPIYDDPRHGTLSPVDDTIPAEKPSLVAHGSNCENPTSGPKHKPTDLASSPPVVTPRDPETPAPKGHPESSPPVVPVRDPGTPPP
uniref:Uncharacterized protein n=1 Tax=Oryza punctata TaxID=4537 RepID=A0A0E0LD17_ORYPU